MEDGTQNGIRARFFEEVLPQVPYWLKMKMDMLEEEYWRLRARFTTKSERCIEDFLSFLDPSHGRQRHVFTITKESNFNVLNVGRA